MAIRRASCGKGIRENYPKVNSLLAHTKVVVKSSKNIYEIWLRNSITSTNHTNQLNIQLNKHSVVLHYTTLLLYQMIRLKMEIAAMSSSLSELSNLEVLHSCKRRKNSIVSSITYYRRLLKDAIVKVNRYFAFCCT